MKSEQLMGLSIIPMTLLGVVCNWLVVIAISTNKSLNHSFSLLTGTQAAFNGAFSVVYLVYVAPMIIFDIQYLKIHSENVGFFLTICYDSTIQTHAIITVNRFCAVFLPLVYKSVFNAKWTKAIILISFVISLIFLTICLKILPCPGYYSDEYFGFTLPDLPICSVYTVYGDIGKLGGMCVFNVIVDTITIWKVRKVRSAQGMTKFQKKEIDFLKQSFGQAVFLMFCILSLYIAPMFTTSRVSAFLLGSLLWPTIHTFDGVLTLYFNQEIRKSLTKKRQINVVSVASSVVIGGKSSTRMG